MSTRLEPRSRGWGGIISKKDLVGRNLDVLELPAGLASGLHLSYVVDEEDVTTAGSVAGVAVTPASPDAAANAGSLG